MSTYEPFVIFSLPCSVEKESDREALVAVWNPAKVNPSQSFMVPSMGLEELEIKMMAYLN